MVISIRVTPYWGDTEDERDLVILGPYATEAARDAELGRLQVLASATGDAAFEASTLDPAMLDTSRFDQYTATAEQVAACVSIDELIDQLHTRG